MNETENQPKPSASKGITTALWLSIASLLMGILSAWAYPFLAYDLYDHPILRQFLHTANNFGILGGIPLGALGIVLGILAWRRAQKNPLVITLAIIGSLLGYCGILGHLWFIFTCQFCN